MFVSFRAARRIEEGEELTVDLAVDTASYKRYASESFSQYCFARPDEDLNACPLMLHKVPGTGVGIFAGRPIDAGTIIQTSVRVNRQTETENQTVCCD